MKPLGKYINKILSSPGETAYSIMNSGPVNWAIRTSEYDDALGKIGLAVDEIYFELGWAVHD